MLEDVLAKRRKNDLKLSARAQIGYLVGYKSTTQYYIWIPIRDLVIHIPHIIFDERFKYKDDIKNRAVPVQVLDDETIQKLQQPQVEPGDVLQQWTDNWTMSSTSQTSGPDNGPNLGGEMQQMQQGKTDTSSPDVSGQPSDAAAALIIPEQTPSPEPEIQETIEVIAETAQSYSDTTDGPAPTDGPDPTDTSASAQTPTDEPSGRPKRQARPSRKRAENDALRYEMLGRIFSAFRQETQTKHHRRDMPIVPRTHDEAMKHEFATEWKNVETTELKGLERQRVYEIVRTDSAKSKPLPLKWVYTYKFNKHGILKGFKARLCVRGDM
jgi:hypothetical protein